LVKLKEYVLYLYWALDNDAVAGEKLVYLLITLVKICGGFRVDSQNYIGSESIANLKNAFNQEGFTLFDDGNISRTILENLSSKEMLHALKAYACRAVKGVDDAALLTGTSKDLMEAVAAFVVQQKWGDYPAQSNFPTLLGQAFSALGLATTQDLQITNEPAQKKVERALYEFACSINKLRNKEGTGHGRPFLTTVSDNEAKLAIEGIGVISEFLLSKLQAVS